jgi:hypothetical protein
MCLLGMENCKQLFGLGSDKEALSAASFEADIGDNNKNLLFCSSGIVSRTLDHWRGFNDAFKLYKSRAET